MFAQLLLQMLSVVRLPIFWIMLVLLTLQIGSNVWRRESWLWRQKQVVYRLPVFLFCVLEQLVSVLLVSIPAGVIASSFLIWIGVSVDISAMPYLWAVMLILFCIRRRFVCFAYAGGILAVLEGISNLFVFDGRGVLMLTAVLHFTEAMLVCMSGIWQSCPVSMRSADGAAIHRTQLQMTWPLPLIMPMHTMTPGVLPSGYVVMPEWWPVFAGAMPGQETAVLYALVPTLAVIGYHDAAEYQREKQHCSGAALLLLGYSVLLGIIVMASRDVPLLLSVAGLFSILGHEAIARIPH